MSALTMTAIMPGHWPADLRSPAAVTDDAHIDTPVSPIEDSQRSQRLLLHPLTTHVNGQVSRASRSRVGSPRSYPGTSYPLAEPERLQVPRPLGLGIQTPQSRPSTPNSTSPNVPDEMFFDCPSPSQVSVNEEEEASISYLIFEPVVEEETNIEDTDWRRYDPPIELLRSQDGLSNDLEQILAPSIERIKARHLEEEQRRAAASRIERPLARAGRASVKPRRQISMTGALNTTHLTPPARVSAGSETSLSSNDSGYGSLSPGTEPSRSPRSATRKSIFSGLLKRSHRTIVNLEELDNNYLPIPRSRDTSPLPQSPRSSFLPSPTRGAPATLPLTGECVSCLDDFETRELIKLTCHSYCGGCFQRLINNALESETHWPAKCCLNPIPSTSIIPHLSKTTLKKYRQREAEWSIPASDRIYCAYPACSTWIDPKHITLATHTAKCPTCQKQTCTTCRGPHHGDVDCPQDPALQATINLAEMEGWKRCYSCHALVEHNQGCRHMTCRCRAQFCYICGLKWRTCACTDAQLATIQQRAETRRADENVRNARAIREEEEERAAIREVEAFIRAEEERIAREIAEAERREEERRAREEEERRRREEERIAAINRRFREMNAALEELHDVQNVLMAERYEFETDVLSKERQDALDLLAVRHPSEVQHLTTSSASKISEAEQKFSAEYDVRLTEERRIEDQYVAELRAFWKGKPDSEYKVREARDELRRDQEREYRFWDAWRRTQMQGLREGEERKIEALRVKQEAEVKAVDGRAKIDGLEWRRKKWAEGRWVEEVTRERIAMLGDMEAREYGRGS